MKLEKVGDRDFADFTGNDGDLRGSWRCRADEGGVAEGESRLGVRRW